MALIAYWAVGLSPDPDIGNWWQSIQPEDIEAGFLNSGSPLTPAVAFGALNPAVSGDNDEPGAWTDGTPGATYRPVAVVFDDVLLQYSAVFVGEPVTLRQVGIWLQAGQLAAGDVPDAVLRLSLSPSAERVAAATVPAGHRPLRLQGGQIVADAAA